MFPGQNPRCRYIAVCVTISMGLLGVPAAFARQLPRKAEAVAKMSPLIRELVAALRSPALKAEAKKQAPLLMSDDDKLVRKAADFFHDLKAKGLLLYTLEHNKMGRFHVLEVFLDIVQPNDVETVRTAQRLLQKTSNVLIPGHYEAQVYFGIYQRKLVALIDKASNLKLAKSLPPFTPGPGYDGVLTPTEIDRVSVAIEAWLKAH